MKSIICGFCFISLLSSSIAQDYSSADKALILEALSSKGPLPTPENKPSRAIQAAELNGEWYIISSNVIPFVDGSVTFTTDGKMITTWQYRNHSDSTIQNKYTFIRPGLIEYPNPSSSEKYQIKALIEKDWLILHWTDGSLHFVLSRHPRA